MSIGLTEVFLGLAVAVYIFIIIDRICKAFEKNSEGKILAAMYFKMDPVAFKELVSDKLKAQ